MNVCFQPNKKTKTLTLPKTLASITLWPNFDFFCFCLGLVIVVGLLHISYMGCGGMWVIVGMGGKEAEGGEKDIVVVGGGCELS